VERSSSSRVPYDASSSSSSEDASGKRCPRVPKGVVDRSGSSSWVTKGEAVVAREDAMEVVSHADSSSVDHDDSIFGDTDTSCRGDTEGGGAKWLVSRIGEARVAEEPRLVCLGVLGDGGSP